MLYTVKFDGGEYTGLTMEEARAEEENLDRHGVSYTTVEE